MRRMLRPHAIVLLSALSLAVSFLFAAHSQRHNPVSHFFAPDAQTYDDAHSRERTEAARTLIGDSSAWYEAPAGKPRPAELGVVLISVRRPSAQYLDTALGSLLSPVSASERAGLYISVLLADSQPETHPHFGSRWLHALCDEIVVRSAPSGGMTLGLRVEGLAHADPSLPGPMSPWHRKGSLDYLSALDACMRSGAPYCLVLEDDVVLAHDWLARVRTAYASSWSLVRAFWAEKYFGWEDYEVPRLVRGCVVVIGGFLLVLLGLRSGACTHWRIGRVARSLNALNIALLTLLLVGHLALLLLSGRNILHPQPRGLAPMPSRGCCNQGLLLRTASLPSLRSFVMEGHARRPVDLLVGEWASREGDILALNPPILQHVGAASSRDFGFRRREPVWSFAFEKAREG